MKEQMDKAVGKAKEVVSDYQGPLMALGVLAAVALGPKVVEKVRGSKSKGSHCDCGSTNRGSRCSCEGGSPNRRRR